MSGGQEPRSAVQDAGIEWYLARDGQQYGPLSEAEMKKLVEFGHLKAADLVWRAGFSDWTAAATAFPETTRQKPPPPPPPPQTAVKPAPAPPAPAGEPADQAPAGPREATEAAASEQTRAAPAPFASRRALEPEATHGARAAAGETSQAPPPAAGAQYRPEVRRPRTATSDGAPHAGARPVPQGAPYATGQPARTAAVPRGPADVQPATAHRPAVGAADIAWPTTTVAPSGRHPAAATAETTTWPGAGPVPNARPSAYDDAHDPHAPHPKDLPRAPHGYPRQPRADVGQHAPAPQRAAPDFAPGPRAPDWGTDGNGAGAQAPQNSGRRSGGRSRSRRHGADTDLPETGPVLDEEHYEPERRRGGTIIALVLVLLLGILGAGGYGLYSGRISPDLVDELKAKFGLSTAGTPTAPVPTPAAAPRPATRTGTNTPPATQTAGAATADAAAPKFPPTAETFDAQLQTSAMWQMIKTDFPAWYQERVKEGARRAAENQDGLSIQRYLLESLVALRREHARHAYASGLDPLKAIADAFRNNLVNLAQHSEDTCYTFISRGEGARAIAQLYPQPKFGPLLEAQMVAVLTAIREGQRRPITLPPPRKDDYAALSAELKAIGWSDDDLKLFADADGLAKAPPAKVCHMVTDWFSAHLRLKNPDAQQRLLAESIRPVVGG